MDGVASKVSDHYRWMIDSIGSIKIRVDTTFAFNDSVIGSVNGTLASSRGESFDAIFGPPVKIHKEIHESLRDERTTHREYFLDGEKFTIVAYKKEDSTKQRMVQIGDINREQSLPSENVRTWPHPFDLWFIHGTPLFDCIKHGIVETINSSDHGMIAKVRFNPEHSGFPQQTVTYNFALSNMDLLSVESTKSGMPVWSWKATEISPVSGYRIPVKSEKTIFAKNTPDTVKYKLSFTVSNFQANSVMSSTSFTPVYQDGVSIDDLMKKKVYTYTKGKSSQPSSPTLHTSAPASVVVDQQPHSSSMPFVATVFGIVLVVFGIIARWRKR